MDTLLHYMKRTELFAGFDEITLREICSHGVCHHYDKGQYVLQPLEKLDRLGIVIKGKLRLLNIFPNGNYSLMATASAGELIGLDLVCTKTQLSPYHIEANTEAQIFWLHIKLLTESGELDDDVCRKIVHRLLYMIANENMRKEYRLAILSQKGLRERIITFLKMQANRLQKTSFELPFSREEMASFLCVNRSALSAELSLMQQEGLISFKKNSFVLHNWDLDF